MKKYMQVMHRIKELIRLEVINEGERLPSLRSMASQMRVSIMTVLEGYRRLENMGIIESHPQSGFYVSSKHYCDSTPKLLLPETGQTEIMLRPDAVIIPRTLRQLIARNNREDILPLGSGLPEAVFFPNEELCKHLTRVSRAHKNRLNQYFVDSGQKELLRMISIRMMEAGCLVQEDELIITGGAIQALMLALRSVTNTGDIVAVESPGYYGFYLMLQFLNLNAIEIPSNPQWGIDLNALQSVLDNGLRPACLLLSSNFSNPTGALMPDRNKETLVQMCSRHNLPIIEDDTLGELYFNTKRPRPLKALAPEQVLYISSFSKILSPGYRIGWLAGGRHAKIALQYYGMSVFMIPVVTQLTLASYLNEGRLKPHLRHLRKQYQENIGLLQNKIAQCFPNGTRISNPKGGQFIWVELPDGYDAVELSIAANKNKISIAPGVLFTSRQHYRKNFRLNCALKWNNQIEKAIKLLGELSESCMGSSPSIP